MFGHRSFSDFDHHPIDKAEEAELDRYWSDPRFQAALARYTKRDPSQNIPYVAGSDNEGTTVFEDRNFAKYVHEGRFLYDGKPFDPTEFLILHEAVEGIFIRLYGFDYAKSHRLATIAERLAVEHAGYDWLKYQEAFKEPVRLAEKESGEGTPKNLLAVAYEGSPLYKRIEANEGVSVNDSGVSDEKAREAADRSASPSAIGRGVVADVGGPGGRTAHDSSHGSGNGVSGGGEPPTRQAASEDGGAAAGAGKLTHSEAGYHSGPASNGNHCGLCRFFQAGPHCRIVIDPIRADDGCEHFKARGQEVKAPQLEQFGGMAPPKLPGPQVGAGKMLAKTGVRPQMTENPKPQTQVGPHVHALTLGGLPHMLAGGHITREQHDAIHASATKALEAHRAAKPSLPSGGGSPTAHAGSGSHATVNEPLATVGGLVHPGTGHDRAAPMPHIARPVGHGHNTVAASHSAGIPGKVKPAVAGSPLEPKRPRRFGSLANTGMY